MYYTFNRLKKKINAEYPLDSSSVSVETKVIRMLPPTCYSVLVIVIKVTYKKLATFLTDSGMKKSIVFFTKKNVYFDFY
jgi:hypothetical protein